MSGRIHRSRASLRAVSFQRYPPTELVDVLDTKPQVSLTNCLFNAITVGAESPALHTGSANNTNAASIMVVAGTWREPAS